MEIWIARGENGFLSLYREKPEIKEIESCPIEKYWEDSTDSYGSCGDLDSKMFPEITFENSPQKIKLELV